MLTPKRPQYLAEAILTTFLAKKRAEVAPGVGQATDLFLITRNGTDHLSDEAVSDMEAIFKLQQKNEDAFRGKMKTRVDAAMRAEGTRNLARAEAAKEANSK